MSFPLHLGVTEAGDGEDGRIKSALGIGALLCDGLGDTIRVSLSEAPEAEIPVARKLVDYVLLRQDHPYIPGMEHRNLIIFLLRAARRGQCGISGEHLPSLLPTAWMGRRKSIRSLLRIISMPEERCPNSGRRSGIYP